MSNYKLPKIEDLPRSDDKDGFYRTPQELEVVQALRNTKRYRMIGYVLLGSVVLGLSFLAPLEVTLAILGTVALLVSVMGLIEGLVKFVNWREHQHEILRQAKERGVRDDE